MTVWNVSAESAPKRKAGVRGGVKLINENPVKQRFTGKSKTHAGGVAKTQSRPMG